MTDETKKDNRLAGLSTLSQDGPGHDKDKQPDLDPYYKEVEGFRDAVSVDLVNRYLLERNFSRMRSVQMRGEEMNTRGSEVANRIQRLEADYKTEVRALRFEHQSTQQAVRELTAEEKAQGLSLKQAIFHALEAAHIPKEKWMEFSPSFDKEGNLVALSRGRTQVQPPR